MQKKEYQSPEAEIEKFNVTCADVAPSGGLDNGNTDIEF
jgi:hypothetical protein